jgi:hypothetical protein
MGWPKCNSTLENAVLDETPIWHDYTFHRIGLWISAITGIIAIALSFFLIMMHATHYLKPGEERHIYLLDHTPSRPLAYTGFCLVYVQETLWGIKPAPLLLSAAFLLAMYRFL